MNRLHDIRWSFETVSSPERRPILKSQPQREVIEFGMRTARKR
jgi:hypothetical protein